MSATPGKTLNGFIANPGSTVVPTRAGTTATDRRDGLLRSARDARRSGLAGRGRDETGPAFELSAGADEAAGAVERAGRELVSEQAVAFVWPRQPERAGLLRGEAEAAVERGVADQQHRGMAAPRSLPHRLADQRRADAALAAVGRDRERPEQQRQPAGPGRDRPQPHRADEAATVGRD